MLFVLDTRGGGHATHISGSEKLRVAGVGFEPKDWPTVRAAFFGWPNNLVAP